MKLKRKMGAYRNTALLVTFFAFLFAGAPAAESARAVFLNELSPRHVLVPGTEAYFIPAPGLVLSGKFDGFESPERRIEVVAANLKESYASILKGFTDASLKTRGVDVKSRGDVMINGAEGVLIKGSHVDGADKWAKWILLLDCGGRTLVVNGVFSGGDGEAAKDVEAMVKGVVVAAARPEQPSSGDMEADG